MRDPGNLAGEQPGSQVVISRAQPLATGCGCTPVHGAAGARGLQAFVRAQMDSGDHQHSTLQNVLKRRQQTEAWAVRTDL